MERQTWQTERHFRSCTGNCWVLTLSLSVELEHGKETCQVLCGTLCLCFSVWFVSYWLSFYCIYMNVILILELVLGIGGRVHWLSFQREPSSSVFVRGRERWAMVASCGCWVQHLWDLLLDSAQWVWLSWLTQS